MNSPPSLKRPAIVRAGRILLGVAVGASFGIAIGALVASWIWGVEAIESEAVNASYLAGAITVLGALVGAVVGLRTGRNAAASTRSLDVAVEQDSGAQESSDRKLQTGGPFQN